MGNRLPRRAAAPGQGTTPRAQDAVCAPGLDLPGNFQRHRINDFPHMLSTRFVQDHSNRTRDFPHVQGDYIKSYKKQTPEESIKFERKT